MTLLEKFEAHHKTLRDARDAIASVVIGQNTVIDLSLITLLSGGHGLLVGMPGLAKTLLVKTIGQAFAFDTKRIQCTPDLMPADILGSEVLDQSPDGTRAFRFIQGPVFSQLLMADEINRASPRTQSALLQAMEEASVTVAGQVRPLPQPFHVLATQNPVEQEGTYVLPEAQLDRFLFQINVDYPSARHEKDMLIATGLQSRHAEITPATDAQTLIDMQALVRDIPIGTKLLDVIVGMVRLCRPNQPESLPEANTDLSWGPSPRAAQALSIGVRARALLNGRPAPTLDDVEALMVPALSHRMALTYSARTQGKRLDAIIQHAFEQAQQRV